MAWDIEYDVMRDRRTEAAREIGANRLAKSLAKTLRGGNSRPALQRVGAWLPETSPTKEVEPERA